MKLTVNAARNTCFYCVFHFNISTYLFELTIFKLPFQIKSFNLLIQVYIPTLIFETTIFQVITSTSVLLIILLFSQSLFHHIRLITSVIL